MSSLTGLASSSITSMIPGLCTAGQMKLVGASSARGEGSNSYGATVSPASISIPALTGSQIAIVYLQTSVCHSGPSGVANQPGAQGFLSASGTGVNVSINCGTNAGIGSSGTGAPPQTLVSAFCTTSTGSQTVTFTGSANSTNASASQVTNQACVFIYSPPF